MAAQCEPTGFTGRRIPTNSHRPRSVMLPRVSAPRAKVDEQAPDTIPRGPGARGLGLRWLTGFLLLFGLVALWSLSTPRYAAPDEPAQAVKAAATVRGELVGRHPAASPAAVIDFVVPKTIALGTSPACFAFKPQISAGCAPAWRSYSGDVTSESYVGRYPPLYYAVVGLPSLLTRGASVLLWMRLVSAAAAAALLSAAFVAASLMPRPRFVLAGAAVALTPMALFLGAVVNPSGLEIAAALCLWVNGLALVSGHAAGHQRWLLVWTAAAAAVAVQMRGLSPLLVLIVLSVVAFVPGWARLRTLGTQSRVRPALGVVVTCAVFALAWIAARGSLLVKPVTAPIPPTVSDAALLRLSLEQVGLETRQPVGVFGWLDTTLPSWNYTVWNVAVLLLLAAAIRAGISRALVAALATTAIAILLPTLLAFSQARRLGIVGQGRYIMPVAVGIPILLGYAASRGDWNKRWVPAALLVSAVAIAVVHVSAFVQALHRYRTGVLAPIWTAKADWNPPITWWLDIVLFAGLVAGVIGWWYRLAAPPGEVAG